MSLVASAEAEVDSVEVSIDGVRLRPDGVTYRVISFDIDGADRDPRLRRIAEATAEAFETAMRAALDRNAARLSALVGAVQPIEATSSS